MATRAAWSLDAAPTDLFCHRIHLQLTLGFTRLAGYGLDRLQIVQGDVTVEDDVKTAVAGVDSVVFCASQRKLPLSTIGFSLVKVGSGSAVVATTTAAATIVTTATTAATTQAAFSKSQEAPGGSVEEEGVALVAGAAAGAERDGA